MSRNPDHADLRLDPSSLRQALAVLKTVVRNNWATLPVMQSVRLTAGPRTGATVTATDIDTEVTIAVETMSCSAALDVLIPLQNLWAMARFAQSPVSIDRRDAQLRMQADGLSFTSNLTATVEDFPIMSGPTEPVSVELTEADLHRFLRLTRHCISSEETRYYLNGVYLHQKPGGETLRAVATDGHRLAIADSQIAVTDLPAGIIHADTIRVLSRILRDDGNRPIRYEVGALRFRLSCDDFTITGEMIDGKYPDYERVIPQAARNNRCTLNSAAMRRLRAIAAGISPGTSPILSIDPAAKRLTVLSLDKTESASLPVTGDGDTIIDFSLRYLDEQTRVTPTAQLEWFSPTAPARITGEDPDAFWVLMPMHV
jgi:DNA polymerase-3 subunit beta